MLREVRNARTGEVIFSTDVEVRLYRWLDDATDGPSPRWKFVMVSYQVEPAFRQAYLSRAQRHETWLLPSE